ncbi:MAG: hypothetical protein CL927_14410 [Deltaproteobacteria bacterium]|nr:hypothetical protein [Deltaproteobacteria bacterium]
MEVVVIGTGVANTASVLAALTGVGGRPTLSVDPAQVRTAERVVLPGVGSFAAGMERLNQTGLASALQARIQAGRPTLGICLGMQLLGDSSEEAPGVRGLGVASMATRRFPRPLVVPQLGWNGVQVPPGEGFLAAGSAYFAHSYRVVEPPVGWRVARTTYGSEFVAAIERGAVLACQFHPELSGPWGLALLQRWLTGQPATSTGDASPRAGLGVRLMPCLDVRDGRVVKGVHFEGLRDAGDPAERAAAYAAQGADELVVLDVSATDEGRVTARRTVQAVRARIALPLTVGGGVRTVEDAGRLLGAGADKVSINTAASRNPDLVTALAEQFGRQCTVVAIDARRRSDDWEVVVRSGKEGTGRSVVDWAREVEDRGAGEILLTSMDRDGTQSGYDLALLRAVSDRVNIPVIASGGARSGSHLVDAVQAGASAVLAASVLHDGLSTVGQLKQDLLRAGVEVRP